LVWIYLLCYNSMDTFARYSEPDYSVLLQEALAAYNDEDYQKAADLFLSIANWYEFTQDPDSVYVAYFFEMAGFSLYLNNDYVLAYPTLHKALKFKPAFNKEAFDTNGYDFSHDNILTLAAYSISEIKESNTEIAIPERGRTQTDRAQFRIKEIISETHDTVVVALDAGAYDGIIPGTLGSGYGIWSEMFTDRGAEYIGSVEIFEINLHSSKATIFLQKPDDPELRIMPGDLVRLTYRRPIMDWQTPLFTIYAQNIRFLNKNAVEFLNFRQLIDYGTPLLEQQVLYTMLDDIRKTALEISGRMQDEWLQPLENKRFSGLNLVEALIHSQIDDIISYLDFVNSFPGNFYGRTLPLNIYYAQWVLDGLSPGLETLMKMLQEADNEESIFQLIEDHSNEIESGNYLTHWVQKSTNYINADEYEKSLEILQIANVVAKQLSDKKALAWIQFNKAYRLDKMGEDELAIAEYNKAYDWFLEVEELEGASFSLNNRASSLVEIGRYRMAFEAYEQAYRLKKTFFGEHPAPDENLSIARSKSGMGYSLYYLGDLSGAMEHFLVALGYIEDVNTVPAMYERAELYNFMGRAFQRQGDENQAVYYHERERDLYISLMDESKTADALDWLAYATSNSSLANELYLEAYEIKKRFDLKDGMAFSLSNVAQTFWQLGDYNKAVEYHLMAIDLREQTRNTQGQAYSWSKLGELYTKSGRINEAFQAYEKATELYDTLSDDLEIASLQKALGYLYLTIEDFKNSIKHYQIALNRYQKLEAMYEYGITLSDLGDVYFNAKEYQKAETLYRESLEIQKLTDDKTGMIYNQIYLGHIYRYFRINPTFARDYYSEALQKAIDLGNISSKYNALSALAGLEVELGNYQLALDSYQAIKEYYIQIGDVQESASILLEEAFIYMMLGEFDKAEALIQTAYETAISLNNASLKARSLSGLGEIYRLKGDYTSFFTTLTTAFDAYVEIDNKWGIANSLISKGNFYNLTNDYENAIQEYMKADSLYAELKVPYYSATPLNNIGNVYFMQGDYEQALAYFKRAYELNRTMGGTSNFTLMIINNIGDAYREKKDYEQAEYWITKALNISETSGNQRRYLAALRSRGNLKVDLNKYEDAFNDFIEVYNRGEETPEVEFQIEVGKLTGRTLMRMNRLNEARDYLSEALDLSRNIGSRRYLWSILGYLGELEFVSGNPEVALEYYRESIEAIEFTRSRLSGGEEAQQLFLASEAKLNIYDAIVRILMAFGEVEEAMIYALKGNIENVQSQFGTQVFSSQEEALQRAREIQLRISGLEQSLVQEKSRPENRQNTKLIEELNALKTIAEENYLSFVQDIISRDRSLSRHLESTVNPNQLRANRRRIPAEMAVIQYLVSTNYLYIFVATSDSVFAREIPIAKQRIDEKALAFYNMHKLRPSSNSRTIGITQPDTESHEMVLEQMNILRDELYQLLIEPVLLEISNRSHIAFIPNGTLNLIPFHALAPFDQEERMLNNTFSTFYNNDLSVFGTQMYEFDEIRLFAIGNADNSLPFAETEVQLLAGLFPGSEVLIRNEATKTRLFNVSEEFNMLHFATHGVLDFQVAENSYLVLADDPDSGDDGRLTINDIFRIRNVENVGMVTLSACETAFNLENMIGWPVNTAIAFLNIGVPSVVATLWQVDDEATSLFMHYFYENIPTMDKATALRNARKSLAENERFNHPYYWAAFTLMGDWR